MGNVLKFIFLFVFCCVLQQPLVAAADSSEPVAVVVSLRGKATITSADGSSRPAKLLDKIFIGDRIETEYKSRIQFDFPDRSKIVLAGSSDYTVTDYAFDGEKEARSGGKIDNGALKFIVGKISKIAPENYKIETATATIGIRGSAGEIETSDGSLPGVPKGLKVRKTAGLGITAQLAGQRGPVHVFSAKGDGMQVFSSGGFQKKRFDASLVQTYGKVSETQIAEGRVKHEAKQPAAGNAQRAAEKEPDAGEKQEKNAEKPADEKQDKAAKQEERKEKRELAKQEKKGAKAERKAERGEKRELAKQERAEARPASAKAAADVGANEEPVDHPEEHASVGQMPPPEPGERITSSELIEEYQQRAAEGAEVGELEALEQLIGQAIQEEVAAQAGGVQQAIAGQRDDGLDPVSSGETEEEAAPAPFPTMTGLMSHFDSTGVRADAVTVTEHAANPNNLRLDANRENLGMTLNKAQLTNAAGTVSFDNGVAANGTGYQRLSDGNGEFFIVNQFNQAPGAEAVSVQAYGVEASPSSQPTGKVFYGSTMYSQSGENPSEQMIGSMLTVNGKVLNSGFASHAVVDFDHNKIGGMTSSPGEHFDEGVSPAYGAHLKQGLLETGHTYYLGEIDGNGDITNLSFFRNLGFNPSHVDMPGVLSPGAPTYGFDDTLLGGMTGSGGFYGSNYQGFAISGSATGQDFIAAGFREAPEPMINSVSGNYVGYGRGMEAMGAGYSTLVQMDLDSVALNVDFGANSVTGTMGINGLFDLSVGAKNLAVNREIVAGELTNPTNGYQLLGNNSFFATMSLPEVRSAGSDSWVAPEGVMWGSWNVAKTDGTNHYLLPGQHNFWVAGQVTTPTGGGSVKDKLGVAEDRRVYQGGLMHSFVDTTGSWDDGIGAMFGNGWEIPSLSSGADTDSSGVDVGSVPFVRSMGGHLSVGVKFDGKKAKVLGLLPDGTVLLAYTDVAGDLDENGYTANVVTYSTMGINTATGLFTDTFSSGLALQGDFASAGAENIFFDYADAADDTSQFAYGVGVATNVTTASPATDDEFSAWAHGVMIDKSSATHVVTALANPDIFLDYQSDVSNNETNAGKIEIDGGAQTIDFGNNDLNTFITKDSLFATMKSSDLSPVQWASNAPNVAMDPRNTYVLALPGLEDYEYINWGIWGSKQTGTDLHFFGYWAGGRHKVDGNNIQTPDFAQIAGSANPNVRYSGQSIGTLFDNGAAQFRQGTAVVDVNFNTGAFTGNVDLGPDAMVGLSGAINAGNATFGGATTLNGGGGGAVKGAFYADEMSGSFDASNGTKKVTGAFGAKSETPIPLTE